MYYYFNLRPSSEYMFEGELMAKLHNKINSKKKTGLTQMGWSIFHDQISVNPLIGNR